MKILAVSDEESPALWDYYVPGRLDGVDLIISCGDLNAKYLSFLVTMRNVPLLYVHGNHDTNYSIVPPEGCDCIDDQIVVYNGIRILGLGGCPRYHRGDHQYTEQEMRRRIRRLRFRLKRLGGVDIVVTHAPPRGVGTAMTGCTRALRRCWSCWTPTSPPTCSTVMSTCATAPIRPGCGSTAKRRSSTPPSGSSWTFRTSPFRKRRRIF